MRSVPVPAAVRAPAAALLTAAALALLAGCRPSDDRERVLLVTTTSVEASGLLDSVLDAFHAAQGDYRLATTAVGSGAALQMGRRGDADVLLTHDPAGEAAFADEGLALEQGPVMMNHFLVAGPEEDPAGVEGSADAPEALRRIATSGATGAARFVSRGDDSGTHARERALWREAALAPWEGRPAWYVEAGTGMGETLQMASQLDAYTLTDRGTFLHIGGSLDLRPLLEGGAMLENHYRYTLPRNAANPEGARAFVDWLTGPGQASIAEYGTPRFGEPLFTPTAHAPADAADGAAPAR